jgi:hypothetical protein
MGRCLSPTLQWSVPHFSHFWTPSPSPSTLGEVVPHPPSPANFFIYSLCGEVSLPPSSGAFHMTATVASLPDSKVAGRGPPLLPSLAGLFIDSLHEELPLPHSVECRAPHPHCYVSFFFSAACLLFRFFFLFSLGRGQSFQGAILICPREYCVLLIC